METKDIKGRMPSMWVPMNKPIDIALVGKAVEEVSELIQELASLQNILGRVLIQGLDGVHPETALLNRKAISDEIADVLAKLKQAAIDWQLDMDDINLRVDRKYEFSGHWFDWLRQQTEAEEEEHLERIFGEEESEAIKQQIINQVEATKNA